MSETTYLLLSKSKTIVENFKIEIHDKKGFWELDVYDSKLDEISEEELHWNLQAQFFPISDERRTK